MTTIRCSLLELTLASLAIASMLVAGNAAFAQETRGTILGTVRDTAGAVIFGATVTVTNTGTNISNQVVSSDSGAFAVPYLTPGPYTLSVDAKGFKKSLQHGIAVNVGSRANIDVT